MIEAVGLFGVVHVKMAWTSPPGPAVMVPSTCTIGVSGDQMVWTMVPVAKFAGKT